MSRINDALKQAQQNQQNQPPAGLPPLTPADGRTAAGVSWMLPALIFLLLIAAGFFIGLAFLHRPLAAAPTLAASAPATNVTVVPMAAPIKVPPAPVIAVPSPAKPITKTNLTGAIAPPRLPPSLKLQGMGMDPKQPWAVINGQTVFVGDPVADFKVTEISGQSVTLKKADGSVKTLSLPE